MTKGADDVNERHLIERAQQGDAGAFGRLYEAYLDQVYRYVYMRISSVAQVEELTEEVFVRAWEALPDYEITRGKSLLAWLYRIAHNLVVDHYRRDSLYRDKEPLFAVVETPPSVEEMVAQKEAAARAVSALHDLDAVEQSVLLLRLVEQLPYREIGEIVGKSAGACRVIQHRALVTLRELLQEEKVDA